jgi:phospholipase C
MTPLDRRLFLKLLSGTAVTSTLMESIAKATAVNAYSRTGTIDDVKHVVILMQENRAFDHYFGTMRGVRGFGDPHPATLPSGKSVWYQPIGNGPNSNGFVLPFHPTAGNFGDQYLVDTAHDWNDTHEAWNGGKYDRWIPTKTPQASGWTMVSASK